jgi:hypothetical protein
MGEKISFDIINYYPCLYCKNLVIFKSTSSRFDDLDEYGCKLDKEVNGKYPELHRYEKSTDDFSLIEKGCNKFISSGLPAHPIVLKEMVKINPLTNNIPSDKNATETGFDLWDKIEKYTMKKQIITGKDLVYNKVLPF